MPERRLSRAEREELSATNLVRDDFLDVEPQLFGAQHMAMLKYVAQQSQVERVFVNPAIKKAICRDARGDRSWKILSEPDIFCGRIHRFRGAATGPTLGGGVKSTVAAHRGALHGPVAIGVRTDR
jgi:hypothetical protein